MDQIELKVDSRRILGKKVRSLRRQGITPVHLFSRDIESMALQCETTILRRVLAKAGKTGLISLKVDSEIKPRTVVVRKVQVEPRTSEILHVDFAQIRMEEEVKVEVPVVLSGESPALKAKENTLVRELNTLNISCLPASIPAGPHPKTNTSVVNVLIASLFSLTTLCEFFHPFLQTTDQRRQPQGKGEDEKSQIWIMPLFGGEARQLTAAENNVASYPPAHR